MYSYYTDASGAFGDDEYMERVCGDVTVAAVAVAAQAGVPRFAFVSASEYGGIPEALARGYFAGKRKVRAEQCRKWRWRCFHVTFLPINPYLTFSPHHLPSIFTITEGGSGDCGQVS